MSGFTNKEKLISDKIVELHNLFMDLEIQHPSDIPDWGGSIHGLQKLLCLRIVRREHPETFEIKV